MGEDRPETGNTISGPVGGSTVQAGHIHGDVYFGPVAPAPIVPRQLHPPPPHFVPRPRELTELGDSISGENTVAPRVVVLRGVGGVGKTALALWWLATIADRYPDGQLFAELTQSTGEPIPVEDVLGRFLRALGVPAGSIPPSLAERAALYRSLTAGKRLAVLLDDATSAAQARVLIPAAPGSLVVVTSRRQLIALAATGAVAIRVDPLDQDRSLGLLAAFVGRDRVDAERPNAKLLTRMCGGLPIALCVTAALIAARPRRSLAWMVDRLRDEHRRLDVLSTEEDYSVRAAFDLAYQDLPPGAATAYRAIGLSPGMITPELVAWTTGTTTQDAADAIDDLVDAGLVDPLDEGWYRPHDLVHVHAKALAADRGDTTAVLRRTVDWYVAATRAASAALMPNRPLPEWPGHVQVPVPGSAQDHTRAVEWVDRVRNDVVVVMRTCLDQGWPEEAYLLGHAMQPLFAMTRQLMAAIEVCALAKSAAEALGDARLTAKMRRRLARLYTSTGRHDSAEREITISLADARDRDDQRALASAYKNLGLLHHTRGAGQAAIAAFAEALVAMRQCGTAREVALLLIEFGVGELAAGVPEAAAAHLDEAVALLDGLPQPDPYNAARARRGLGRTRLALGEHDAAAALLTTALAVFDRYAARHDAATTHQALAELARTRGNPEAERQHDERAGALLGHGQAPPSADEA
ncbi:NB-ARC domain-containing protein [Actinokineospora terrae]|uniref:ATP-, maltotriose-and DNA-dependent transcriptional regulator MalT n=1 Tax=Actinokineospora terrae TaxID=155974 RepID=A0A1H9VWB3_9PSEU|nr:NB-ARC domain-containing protein [Actinokineospora terrae]SES25828.1 ATP-, maltotriose-and DNA-dependent transcriptional regulator MalT [Actinokineospora terrae]